MVVAYNDPPWIPIQDSRDLRVLGKLSEELGECQAAVARCIIQGIDSKEPNTQKVNRQWLNEEIADVMANLELVIEHFKLPMFVIGSRRINKKIKLREWQQQT